MMRHWIVEIESIMEQVTEQQVMEQVGTNARVKLDEIVYLGSQESHEIQAKVIGIGNKTIVTERIPSGEMDEFTLRTTGNYIMKNCFAANGMSIFKNKNKECLLCKGSFDSLATLSRCGHELCSKCVVKSAVKNKRCPICKKGFILQKEYLQLYIKSLEEKMESVIAEKRNTVERLRANIVQLHEVNDYYCEQLAKMIEILNKLDYTGEPSSIRWKLRTQMNAVLCRTPLSFRVQSRE